MKKSFWCCIGIHKWFYSLDKISRTCKKCQTIQEHKDIGDYSSGYPDDYWKTIN